MKIHYPSIFPEDNIISGLTHGENSPSFSGKHLDEETKNRNRDLLSRFLNVENSRLLFQRQVHRDTICVAYDNYIKDESDAIITDKPGLVLNVSIADCIAILLFDPINYVVAGIHSGWKGTQLNIAGKTISLMQEKFKVNPSELLVYISPSASEANYEVGDEFVDIFPNFTKKYPDGKLHFDNRSAVLNQLTNKGINMANAENHDECTIADKKYHSYRRDKENSGRMTAFIGLK